MARSIAQRGTSLVAASLVFVVLACTSLTRDAGAASWQRIEPFKTHRAEVLQILGTPISESADGVLRFSVSGGSVQISFVNEKFVTAKKLRPELAGTVLEIVLQHEHSSETAESMNLPKNKGFVRDEARNIVIFRNIKDGIVYTFIDGRLKTTRYTFADSQLSRARR
jgi:hypothetical protein